MRFIECSSVSEYCDVAHDSLDALPVLLPPDPIRRSRWRHVLDWYTCFQGSIAPRSVSEAPEGFIVSVDSEFEPVAAKLARWSGLRLHTAARRDLVHFLAVKRPPAVTVVGTPSSLDAETTRAIAGAARMPWTIVSARDLPAVTFAAAKLLSLRIGRMQAPCWLALDAFMDKAVHISPEGNVRDLGAIEARWLDLQMAGGLILRAHGEGAHLDLKRAVLCGLLDTVERTALGATVPGGCRVTSTGPICKRQAGRHERIVQFHSLQTPRVALLTCNGYVPNGEGYHSNVSAVLSCLDGYVSEIVTSLRPLSFADGILIACGQLAVVEQGLAALASVLSDLSMWEARSNAIVRIGALAEPEPSASASLDPEAALQRNGIVTLGRSSEGQVISADGAIVRGEHIVLFPAVPAPVECPVDNGLENLLHVQQQLLELAYLMDRTSRWERALADHVAGSQPSRARRRLAELRQASRRLWEARWSAEAAVSESHNSGIVRSRMPLFADLLTIAMADWDQSCARLLETLKDDYDPTQLFHDGWRDGRIEQTGLCDRCGAPIERRTLLLPFTRYGSGQVTECPNCGPRDLSWQDASPIEVTLPRQIAPGSFLNIRMRRRRRDDAGLGGWTGHGWVLAQLRDKAAGQVIVRRLVKASHGEAEVALMVSSDCTPDLHTLKITWVERLTLAVARRRIACVPEANRSGRRNHSAAERSLPDAP
jgi:hypothetical protein